MRKTTNETISKSFFIRFLIAYIAFIATISVIIGGYNQQVTCITQKQNTKSSLKRNVAINDIIDKQISLYKSAKDNPNTDESLKGELQNSIDALQDSREIIKHQSPKAVGCILPGGIFD